MKLGSGIILMLLIVSGTIALITPGVASAATLGCGSKIRTSTVLVADIGPCSLNGITINTSNIVLNCNGHTIEGTGVGDGIIINSGSIVVENCKVSGFKYGFFLHDVTFVNMTGNSASNSKYGFYLKTSNSNLLVKNTAEDNSGAGFYMFRAHYNNLTDNVALNNAIGFYFNNSSQHNTVADNSADGSSQYGYQDIAVQRHPTFQTYEGDECSGNLLGGSSPTGLCAPQS